MKFSGILFLLVFYTNMSFAFTANNKGLYGDDNRRAIQDSSIQEQKLARSVLAQVPLYKLISSNENGISFEVKTPHEILNLCVDEKFSLDTMLSSCSGFLVAPDLLLTAGHCVKDKNDCAKNIWLLDYDQSGSEFNSEQIVYCKEIVDSNASADYALLRLDRSLTDRTPLTLRRTGKLNPNANFTVIGHPLGLPKVVTDQGFLRGNLLNKTFTISSDTYSGNSGSPVIDSKTSIVEGILIRGDQDFEMDYEFGCEKSLHCDLNSCKGETVLRSIYIPSSVLH